MVGKVFGQLTVLNRAGVQKGHVKWQCLCSCGNTTVVDAGNLRSGHTKTCGHCERYYYLTPTTMVCRLPNGNSFLFDAYDYSLISKHKWSIENSGYVHTTNNGKHVRLHNYLLGKTNGIIDHINGIRSDNRRCNLRICTNKENVRNQGLSKLNTSGYKGVSFNSKRNKYEARICVDGKGIFLGYFQNPVDAALAYDKAASFYFGEYAKPNFGIGGIYEQILEMETA